MFWHVKVFFHSREDGVCREGVEWKDSVDVMSCSVAIIKWFNLSESSRLSIWPCEWSRLLLLIWKCAASSLKCQLETFLKDTEPALSRPPLACTQLQALISLFSFSNNLHNHHTETERLGKERLLARSKPRHFVFASSKAAIITGSREGDALQKTGRRKLH